MAAYRGTRVPIILGVVNGREAACLCEALTVSTCTAPLFELRTKNAALSATR